MTVLLLVERDAGAPIEASLQAVTLARDVADQTGSTLAAVTVGEPSDDATATLAEYGVDDVYAITHDRLDAYAPEAWASSLVQLADDIEPSVLLAAGTDRGNEVLARVAAERDLPMAANCVDVDAGDPFEVTRHRWGGSLLEHARVDASPAVLTTPPHEVSAEPAAASGAGAVSAFEPTLEDDDFRVVVADYEESDTEGVPLGEARVVVSGGRGVGSAEGFEQLETLADHLGAAVGSSRAAVNEGWRPHDDQVGQTGAKISPTLYIACGISGAVQHMVGCKGADTIMAVNTDSEANIIQQGDYAVIADLHEVVPALNDALEARE